MRYSLAASSDRSEHSQKEAQNASLDHTNSVNIATHHHNRGVTSLTDKSLSLRLN
jgi:hypothetical protein